MRDLPTPLKLLVSLSPPPAKDGSFINGNTVAHRLRCMGSELVDLDHDLAQLFRDTAGLIDDKTDLRVKGGLASDTSFGMRSSHATWSALTDQLGSTRPLNGDMLRAVIVFAHIRRLSAPREPTMGDPAERLSPTIRTFDMGAGEVVFEEAKKSVLIALVAPTTHSTRDAWLHMQAAIKASQASIAAEERIGALLREVFETWPSIIHANSVSAAIAASPTEDGSLFARLPQSEGTIESAPVVFAAPEEREHGVANERRAAERSGFLLATALGSISDQQLTEAEGWAISGELLRRGKSVLEEENFGRASAIRTILLALLTSRGFIDLSKTIEQSRGDPQGENAITIDLDRGIWRSRLPGAHRFWKPPSSQRQHFTAVDDIEWPIPDEALAFLRAFDAKVDLDRFAPSTDDGKAREIKQVLAQLCAAVSPRVTEGRLRLSLAAKMVETSQEICNALALVGGSLGQSTAPLHYFATPHDDLVRVYTSSCMALTGLNFSQLPSRPDVVGAPLAAGIASVVKEFIGTIKDEIHRSHRSNDPASWQLQLNAISTYTARMWGAATGHRMNSNLNEISLGLIDARGWAVMPDKAVDSSASVRAVALPKGLIRQIETLRLLIQQIVPVASGAAKARLNAAINGQGPLFLVCDPGGHIRPITPDDLRHKWLEERSLQRNIFRPHLRMALTKLGVSNELVFRQMGHVNNGLQPYGEQCPVSIREHSELLSDTLERLLEQDGWEVLPVRLSRQKPIGNWPCPTINSSMAREWGNELRSAFRQWRHARKVGLVGAGITGRTQQSRISQEQVLGRIDEWVLGCIRVAAPHHRPASPAREVQILEDHILVWIDSLLQQEFLPCLRPLALRRLRLAVVRLRKEFAWKGILPPRLFEHRFMPPAFGRPHIQAGRLFEHIRASILKGHRTAECSPLDELTGRLAVLLIIDYTVFDQIQLNAAIDAVTKKKFEPDPVAPDHLLIEIVAGQNQTRSVRLSRAASMTAKAVALLQPQAARTLENLDASIANILQEVLLPASTRLLLNDFFGLQRLAARVERPGVIWPLIEKGDLQTFALADTLAWRMNALGCDRELLINHEKLEVLEKACEPVLGLPIATGKNRLPNRPFKIRLRQYQDFRAGLHERCESAATDQGLDHFRYTEAKKWCEESLAGLVDGDTGEGTASTRRSRRHKKKLKRSEIWKSVDPTNRLLIEFVLKLVASKKKIRVRTIYDYLTGIGIPLLKALDDRGLEDLDGDELDAVFESVIDQTPNGRKSGVASRLLRFYSMFEDRLAEADTNHLRQVAGTDKDSPVRAAAITLKEYEAVRGIVDLLHENRLISKIERLHARNLVALMYRLGLRTREVVHRILDDVITIGDRYFLYVRTTPLGLVKTRASRRFIDLTSALSPDELQDLRTLCDDARTRIDESQRKSPPLFLLSGIGESATSYDHRRGTAGDLLRLIRVCLKHVTGKPMISLHSLRHSVATRRVSEAWLERPTAPESYALARSLQGIATLLGHVDFRVTFLSYFHLAHLVSYDEVVPTSRGMEALTLEKAATIRRRELRLKTGRGDAFSVRTDPSLASQSNRLPEITELVWRDLAINTDELIPFLSAIELGHDIGSTLRKVKVGERVLTDCVIKLHQLGQEMTLTFLNPEVERDLYRRLDIVQPFRRSRFKRIVPGSRLLHDQETLRQLARSLDHWSAENLSRLVNCARKHFKDLSIAETEVTEQAKKVLSRSCGLLDAAWIASLMLASHPARRQNASASL